jgi:hypothetical protein
MNPPETLAPEETEVVSSNEQTHNATAAFLFDEPNPIFEDVGGVVEETVTPTDPNAQISDLSRQAAAAQVQVDQPVVITPAQEAQILAQQQQAPIQLQPIIAPVAQQQQAPVVPQQQQMVQPVSQQQQQAAPPSADEIARQLNVYSLTQQDYDAVFETDNKADSIKALDSILQKAVRQAVTMSNVLVQEQVAQIQQQVQPYMQFADEQKHSALEQAFYGRHADLQAARPVVDAVLKQFQQGGQKFANPEQLFDAVAQNTKAYLLQLQQLGQTAAPVTQGQMQTSRREAPVSAKPAMAALPSGGSGGAGAGGGNSGKTNTAQSLFG